MLHFSPSSLDFGVPTAHIADPGKEPIWRNQGHLSLHACFTIKAVFHNKAVEVVYIPIYVIFLPLFSWLWGANCSHSRPKEGACLKQPGTTFPACQGLEMLVLSSPNPSMAATKCSVCWVVLKVKQPVTHPSTNRNLCCLTSWTLFNIPYSNDMLGQ